MSESWDFEHGDEIARDLHADVRLGGGDRFEAYVAFDAIRRCSVVVKLARPHVVDDPASRLLLEREGETLGTVRHPVVVRLLDTAIDDERPHLVLEHIEGPRLSTLTRRHGALPLEQILPLGVQLASALAYLQALELVHLDVKPKNVIMAGPPRLIDFSVARSTTDAAQMTTPVGTRTYMAPEQCHPRSGAVGASADVWGLGTLLYEAVAGVPAFSRSGSQYPQLDGPPAPLHRDVPAPLADVIVRCLDPVPTGRPTPTQIADALEDLVAALPRRMTLSRLRPGMRIA